MSKIVPRNAVCLKVVSFAEERIGGLYLIAGLFPNQNACALRSRLAILAITKRLIGYTSVLIHIRNHICFG